MYSEQKYTLILRMHCSTAALSVTPSESGGHRLRGQALRHCGTAFFGCRRVAPRGKRTHACGAPRPGAAKEVWSSAQVVAKTLSHSNVGFVGCIFQHVCSIKHDKTQDVVFFYPRVFLTNFHSMKIRTKFGSSVITPNPHCHFFMLAHRWSGDDRRFMRIPSPDGSLLMDYMDFEKPYINGLSWIT